MIDSPDHTLYKPTDEEVQMWRDAAQPLIESWKEDVKKVGGDPDKIYADFEAALKNNDSRY